MFNDHELFVILITIAGVFIAPYLSFLIEHGILYCLYKIYQTTHEYDDEDDVFFSCWAGKNSNFILHIPVHILSFICFIWFFLASGWQFYIFLVVALLIDTFIYWNTLVKIELNKRSFRINRFIFGTDTEIYDVLYFDIIKVETEPLIRKFPINGLHLWTKIYLKNNRTIYFPAPKSEDMEMFYDFIETARLNHATMKEKNTEQIV